MTNNVETLENIFQAMLEKVMTSYFDLHNHAYDYESEYKATGIKEAYESLTEEACKLLPNSPCYVTDPWLWQDYWDAFKDETGIRPRNGNITRNEVKAWFAKGHPFITE